jgi:nitrilase
MDRPPGRIRLRTECQVRTTVVQMAPGSSLPDNIAQASDLIAAAVAADRPDLVVLPKSGVAWAARHRSSSPMPRNCPTPAPRRAPALYRFLSETARTHGITLHGGSIGQRHGDRLLNTSLVFGPDGVERARYSKIHLFDITTPAAKATARAIPTRRAARS